MNFNKLDISFMLPFLAVFAITLLTMINILN